MIFEGHCFCYIKMHSGSSVVKFRMVHYILDAKRQYPCFFHLLGEQNLITVNYVDEVGRTRTAFTANPFDGKLFRGI